MAIQATLRIQITVSGTPGGAGFDIDYSEEFSPAIGQPDIVNLTTTLTALTIPAGTNILYIVPPAGNTGRIEIAGDNVAGAELHPTRPGVYPVDNSSVVFIGCQTGTVTGVRIFYI